MDRYFAETGTIEGGTIRLYFGESSNGRRLSRREVLRLWTSDDTFCGVFSQALASVPIDAYFWETPVFSKDRLERTFECVLTPSPSLAKQLADPRPFATQFGSTPDRGDVVVFRNLGGDADLVAPCPNGDGVDHAHLASFLRTAPARQARALWLRVAQMADLRLAQAFPFWISTSGLGVSWLHVRLDSRPKYYAHTPYRSTD